ncbi:MAG: GatB/YqeY domain-containing protein [bacterium]|nr:GatB/YqeY domain-containing protein [bacterium]
MSLLETLKSDVLHALKKGDGIRVETLRFLLADIQTAAIGTYGNQSDAACTDDDVRRVIKKQVKSHKESISAFEHAGRTALADHERAQLAILESFLPPELTEQELRALLAPVLASQESNFGILMKQAIHLVEGRADNGRIAAILKECPSV